MLGMQKKAPSIADNKECWYLPIFGVYSAKKTNKIRVVFDSSCKFEGMSLNDVLLQGPDLLNRLDGVLLRFRREPYAVVADIEQMSDVFSSKFTNQIEITFDSCGIKTTTPCRTWTIFG